MHSTEIFFLLDDGTTRRVPQPTYAAVVSGRMPMSDLARKRVRVADWYVERLADGTLEVENETYSILYFDDLGRALLFPDRELIEENKSLHAGSSTDPYAGLTHGIGSRREAAVQPVADYRWTPSEDERAQLLQQLQST